MTSSDPYSHQSNPVITPPRAEHTKKEKKRRHGKIDWRSRTHRELCPLDALCEIPENASCFPRGHHESDTGRGDAVAVHPIISLRNRKQFTKTHLPFYALLQNSRKLQTLRANGSNRGAKNWHDYIQGQTILNSPPS